MHFFYPCFSTARSSYFNNLFEANMEETRTCHIAITDFKYEVVQEMFRYIYTAEVPRLFDFATDLLKAADKVGFAFFSFFQCVQMFIVFISLHFISTN